MNERQRTIFDPMLFISRPLRINLILLGVPLENVTVCVCEDVVIAGSTYKSNRHNDTHHLEAHILDETKTKTEMF